MNTWPWEQFMVTAAAWSGAGDPAGFLCVACLEERLGRVLGPEDFPALALNDDHEVDSVRLRTRKGSGRAVEGLYRVAVDAVLDLGVDSAAVAEVLGINARLLEVCVDQAQFGRVALGEIEADALTRGAGA